MKKHIIWVIAALCTITVIGLVTTFSHQTLKALPQFDLVDTFAGTGEKGFVGDGLNAFLATFNNPVGVYADNIGNVYVADIYNNRIRKIDMSMVMTTIAGSSEYGYYGDEMKALSAALAFPSGICVETINPRKKTANIYIVDTRNNRIRRINRYGVITTICGTGEYLYSGDRGPATKASLAWPNSCWLDNNGNLYIADTGNNVLRVIVSPKNTTHNADLIAGMTNNQEACQPNYIYKIAGTGLKGYSSSGKPGDPGQEETPQYGMPRKISAIDVNLNQPFDLCVVYPNSGTNRNVTGDGNERIYFSDTGNHIIRYIDAAGNVVRVAGLPGVPGYNGDILAATNEKLRQPLGLWVDNQNEFLYVCDSGNRRIRVIAVNQQAANDNGKANADSLNGPLAEARIKTLAGNGFFGFSGDGSDAKMARLSRPMDICGTQVRNFRYPDREVLYFSDMVNQRIRMIVMNARGGVHELEDDEPWPRQESSSSSGQ